MLPTFQPRTQPHRRTRAEAAVSPPPPPPLTVVSVQLIDEMTLLWTFSRPVTSPGNTEGFIGGFDLAEDCLSFAGNTLTLQYGDSMSVGDPWQVDPGDVDTVFDPPGVLGAQSGTISA